MAVAAITGRRIVEAIIGRLLFRLLPPHLSRLAPLFLLTALALLPHTAHSTSSSPPPGVDTHGTGMSDLWQRHFNQGELFDPANPAHHPEADPDNDGWSNLKESIAGTDPFCGRPPEGLAVSYVTYLKDQEEALPPDFPDGREIDLAIVSWDTVPGKIYTLKASPDLEAESWIEVAGPFHGSGMPEAVSLLLTDGAGETAPRLFWRVRIDDVDSDGDGLTNYEEWLLGTNPGSAETHPGIPDLWIATHFPTAVGFAPDALSANGGYTMAESYFLGIDPNATDLPTDAVPNDPAATWPRVPEPRLVWMPMAGWDEQIHGQPQALAADGTAVFSKAVWRQGAWDVVNTNPITLPWASRRPYPGETIWDADLGDTRDAVIDDFVVEAVLSPTVKAVGEDGTLFGTASLSGPGVGAREVAMYWSHAQSEPTILGWSLVENSIGADLLHSRVLGLLDGGNELAAYGSIADPPSSLPQTTRHGLTMESALPTPFLTAQPGSMASTRKMVGMTSPEAVRRRCPKAIPPQTACGHTLSTCPSRRQA